MTTTSSYESLSHSKLNCKYHLVFIPKYRKQVLYGKIRKFLAAKFHELALQKGCKIEKGSMVQDHVHMLIIIPPKLVVSKERNFNGEKFWARGYAFSTVGFEEEQIRSYIKNQEQLDSQGYDEQGEF